MCHFSTDQDEGMVQYSPFLKLTLGVATEKPRLSRLWTEAAFIPWQVLEIIYRMAVDYRGTEQFD